MDVFEDFDDVFINDEVEIINFVNPDRRAYNTENRFEHVENFHSWDDLEFVRRFRLSKQSVLNILALVENNFKTDSERNNPFTPLEQLLVTLRFYATGSFYVTVGDFARMHKSTASSIIKKVTSILAQLRPTFIHLPETEYERNEVIQKFYAIARFPRVLGALDGTHIKMQSPGGENAEVFRNRKGYFSINVQVISDACNKIMDIVARWPGSAHDTNIFLNSAVRMRLENGEIGNGLILGDSGYPVRQYLMTPVNNPTTPAEMLYNEAHIRTRNVVERTFGIWKRRFPILSIGMRCSVPLMQDIIIATAILHNVACGNRDVLYENDEQVDLGHVDVEPLTGNNEHEMRRNVINYFAEL